MHRYDLRGYGAMIRDRLRTGAYCQALARAVKPGDVVVDLGAGAAIFTLHACRLGARLVHAIEPNDAIQIAREVVHANGFSEQVTFHHAMSFQVELSEPCDVLVTDPRGVLPLYEQAIPTIIDARRRLLKPGGVLIPQRDTIGAALVEAPDIYHKDCENAWRSANDGFDMEAARQRAINNPAKHYLDSNQLLSDPVQWLLLDFRVIEQASVSGVVQFGVKRLGTAHGFALWFDSELIDGVNFSNCPGQPRLIYGQMFFPFQEPLSVLPNQTIAVDLRADLIGGDYIWQWTTQRASAASPEKIERLYHQSSLFNNILGPERLKKMSDQHVPSLNEEGFIHMRALELMNSRRPLGQIAETMAEEFPKRFSSPDDALGFVGELSARWSD
jgi:Arginine methyltransferase oligomerization subdomain/Ribosomal protein L11 methyltransferase (PrmA)